VAVRPRLITWRGHCFAFEPLTVHGPVLPDAAPVYAVMRGGEFIGTMRGDPHESPEELEARCVRWLMDLLGEQIR
jgi:hypothetical protein